MSRIEIRKGLESKAPEFSIVEKGEGANKRPYLRIDLPVDEQGRPSSSGDSLLLANSGGWKGTGLYVGPDEIQVMAMGRIVPQEMRKATAERKAQEKAAKEGK